MNEELKDLLRLPNKDTIFMSDFDKYEDEVVHIELIGKRRVYSEAAYNRLRDALKSIRDMAPPGAWDDTFHQAPSWWRARVRNMHDAADEALQEAEG